MRAMTYEEYKKVIMTEIRKLNKMEFKSVEDERFYQGMVFGMIRAIERTAGFSEAESCRFNNEIMSKVKF